MQNVPAVPVPIGAVMSVQLTETLTALENDFPAAAGVARCGALVRVLAAARSAGVILLSGDGLYPLAPFLLDGADMGGKVIVNVENAALADALAAPLSADIRCTVHCQPRAAFFSDVRRHRFSLILLQDAGRALSAAAAAVLAEYGMMVLCGEGGGAVSDGEWNIAAAGDLPLRIATRRQVGPAVRRGGRRAHRARWDAGS